MCVRVCVICVFDVNGDLKYYDKIYMPRRKNFIYIKYNHLINA